MLSDRVRPGVEAAPWVIEEIKKLEAENAKLKAAMQIIASREQRIGFGSLQGVARAALGEK